MPNPPSPDDIAALLREVEPVIASGDCESWFWRDATKRLATALRAQLDAERGLRAELNEEKAIVDRVWRALAPEGSWNER